MAKGSPSGSGSDSSGNAPQTPSPGPRPQGHDEDAADGRSALFEHLARASPSDAGTAGADASRMAPASVMGAADGRSLLIEHLARAAGEASPGASDAERSRMMVEALASMVAGADGRSLLMDQLGKGAGPAPHAAPPDASILLTRHVPAADGRSMLVEQMARAPSADAGGPAHPAQEAGPAAGAGAQPTVADLLASILAAPEGRSLLMQQIAKAGGGGPAQPGPARQPGGSAVLAPGSVVGRFEMLRELGSGGFGVVFEARDRDLGRSVAFKAVRPGVRTRQLDAMLLKEAESAARLQHENIVAIFDYGQAASGPYLVLELLKGETLSARIARGALPANEAVHVGAQVARALAHAHGAGLLHRDLKPGNVFLTESGGVKVMDLGLANFFGQPTGLSGTPAYMAPEQWKGEAQDGRTDVFALGVTLYEMLAARRPYEVRADRSTVLDPGPEPKLDVPHVPPRLRKLVERCIAKDPAKRPASARAVQEELLVIERLIATGVARKGQMSATLVLLGVMAVLAVGGVAAWKLWPRKIAQGAPRSVLVADFANKTGEDVFDATLEPAIGIALEGAPFITAYNRRNALATANKLQLQGSGLDEERSRLIAQREGIHVVVGGSTEKTSKGYRVTARAIDGFTGNTIAEKTEEVPGKDAVLGAAGKLAVHIRTALGDTKPEAVQLKESETYSAGSLEAAHTYAQAMKLQAEGKPAEAAKAFQEAVRLDPKMSRAFSGLAVAEYNAGHHAEADRYLESAMATLDSLTEREKLRTRGLYYAFKRDSDAAITANEALVKEYPADTAGWNNLAVAHEQKREFPQAVQAARRSVEVYPRHAPMTSNVGLFELFSGNVDEAIRMLQRAIEISPTYTKALVGLATAQILAGKRDEAKATWARAKAAGGEGASAASEGLADLAVYDGRPSEARAILEGGVQVDLAGGDKDEAASKLVMLAAVQLASGQPRKAIAAAEQAVQLSKQNHIVYAAGQVLAEAGESRRALALADEFEKQVAAEPRAYAEMLRGAVSLRKGAAAEAVAHFRASVKLVNTWPGHLELARAYVEAGSFNEALEETEKLEKRRGEAADVFVSSSPTLRYLPQVTYLAGRAREGLKDPKAAESYKAFLATKQGTEDPLAADAAKRLAKLGK